VSGSGEPFSGGSGSCWANPAATDIGSSYLALAVTPSYFSTLGLTVRRGRPFTPADRDEVVIVNEAFLGRFPKTAEVLGSVVRLSGPAGSARVAQIIGVVDNGYERMPRGQAP